MLHAKTLALAVLLLLAIELPPSPAVVASPSTASFSFTVAGDYGGLNSGTTGNSVLMSVKNQNPNFHLALGDLGYGDQTPSEWCSSLKGIFPYFAFIAGNHDTSGSDQLTSEDGPGYLDNSTGYASQCDFRIPDATWRGSGTNNGAACTLTLSPPSCYGREYYFDYPATNPIARFILISPGIGGSWPDYSKGSQSYNWVANLIDGARAGGIPWVFAAMHKNCLTTGTVHTSCETGPDIQDLLVTKKVDMVLNGHEHNYERSKQLTCADTSSYNASCVVNPGPSYVKGTGSVIITQGTGGAGSYSVNRPISQYYAAAEDSDYGFIKYTVSETSLNATFISVSGSFTDSFSIDGGPQRPGPATNTAFLLLWLGVGVTVILVGMLSIIALSIHRRSRATAKPRTEG